MKTFYSILYLNIKPEINERLSLGMLMVFGEKGFYRYSRQKLSVAQKLISKDRYKASAEYLKLVEKAVEGNDAILNTNNFPNLNAESRYQRLFSEQYIAYLSRYNNNLISFSKPKLLDVACTEDLFKKLFVKLIDEAAFDTAKKHEKRIEVFKKQFYPTVNNYFNVEKELSPVLYSGLITPVKVDLLGKNKNEVFAHSFDFEKKLNSIEWGVGNLLQINKAIPRAKQFILGYEPDKKMQTNHHIWRNLRDLKEFEYIDISEADKITEYAFSHGVRPLLD